MGIHPTTIQPTNDPTETPTINPTTSSPTDNSNAQQFASNADGTTLQNLTLIGSILGLGVLIICLTICVGLYYSKKSKERKAVIADLQNMEKSADIELSPRSA